MLRRLRRPLTLLAPVVVLAGVLAACGSNASDAAGSPLNPTVAGLDAVSISGDVGAAPRVTWKSSMSADAPASTTLVTGKGMALTTGDQVYMDYWLGDGYTRESAVFDTFGAKSNGVELTIGQLPTKVDTIDGLVQAFISQQIKAGVTLGSRIAITVNATQLFGQNVFATPVVQKNIGNEDGLLLVVDLQTPILTAPDGSQQALPSWAPKPVYAKGGTPSGLDFKGVAPLGSKLKVGILKKGTGAPLKSGQHMVVDYLGEVYQATKPFDESFTTQDFVTTLGNGSVIKGWDQGLVGVPVGSRVILGIPPALGYGASGSGKSIPPDATLYFVIDVLAAT